MLYIYCMHAFDHTYYINIYLIHRTLTILKNFRLNRIFKLIIAPAASATHTRTLNTCLSEKLIEYRVSSRCLPKTKKLVTLNTVSSTIYQNLWKQVQSNSCNLISHLHCSCSVKI